MHRALILKYAEILRERGYAVELVEQRGKEEQPDMIAYKKDNGEWKEFGVEVEVRGDHPEQILKNYEKNREKGREVIFVVPNEKVAERIKRILGERENCKIETVEIGK